MAILGRRPVVPGITTPLTGVSFNSQWAGYASTRLKALAWSVRKRLQVATIKKLSPDVVMVQEMGQAEAAEFFGLMGDVWSYQRYGPLNCVGWRIDKLTYDSTLNIDLPDYGQYPGRGALIVKLRDKTGNRLRISAGHLPVKTSNDAKAQADSIQQYVSKANDDVDDWPIVAGFDLNNRAPAARGNVRGILRDYGWDLYTGLSIDAVMANFGAKCANVRSFDLGRASDHDGRVFTITTSKR